MPDVSPSTMDVDSEPYTPSARTSPLADAWVTNYKASSLVAHTQMFVTGRSTDNDKMWEEMPPCQYQRNARLVSNFLLTFLRLFWPNCFLLRRQEKNKSPRLFIRLSFRNPFFLNQSISVDRRKKIKSRFLYFWIWRARCRDCLFTCVRVRKICFSSLLRARPFVCDMPGSFCVSEAEGCARGPPVAGHLQKVSTYVLLPLRGITLLYTGWGFRLSFFPDGQILSHEH